LGMKWEEEKRESVKMVQVLSVVAAEVFTFSVKTSEVDHQELLLHN
jgi:hypothetical protein